MKPSFLPRSAVAPTSEACCHVASLTQSYRPNTDESIYGWLEISLQNRVPEKSTREICQHSQVQAIIWGVWGGGGACNSKVSTLQDTIWEKSKMVSDQRPKKTKQTSGANLELGHSCGKDCVRFTAIFIKWIATSMASASVERTEHILVPLHKTTRFYCSVIPPELIRYNRSKIHTDNFINKSLNLGHKTSTDESLLPDINSFTSSHWRKYRNEHLFHKSPTQLKNQPLPSEH